MDGRCANVIKIRESRLKRILQKKKCFVQSKIFFNQIVYNLFHILSNLISSKDLVLKLNIQTLIIVLKKIVQIHIVSLNLTLEILLRKRG